MLTPGTLLQGRYRVVGKLGEGGMGTVYEAVDERLDATVALKETSFDDEEMRRQFEREARLLARLQHEALPRVSDHFSEGGGQFLVMQFVEGEDLDAMRRAREGGSFPPAQVLAWADQLLEALEYLHARQPPVIHRDIKPQNLKLDPRGRVMLLDFGLAKGYASRTSPHAPAPSVHGGTPAYAPLEQMQGAGTDARSDIYSLAATLYHLLTGVAPANALARADAAINGKPDPLRPADELSARVSKELASVLTRALALPRDRRTPTASAMRRELRDAARQQESIGTAPTVPMTPTPPKDVASDERPSDSEGGPQSDPSSLTATQRHHLEYWTAFRKHMEWRRSFIVPTKPPKDYWMSFSVGRGGFGLDAYNGMRDKWIGVGLVLSGPDAKSHFRLLRREREQIEREIGAPLEWQEKATQKNSVVTFKLLNIDPKNKKEWGAQHEWLLDYLEAFHKAFSPRIKNLRADDSASVKESAAVEITEPAPPMLAPRRTRRRTLIIGIAAGLLVLVVSVGALLALKVFRGSDSSGSERGNTGGGGGPNTGGGGPNQADAADPSMAGANSQALVDDANSFLASGEQSRTLKAHGGPVTAVVFSLDGSLLASGGYDKTVRLWDARTGDLRQTVSDLGDSATLPVTFSASGQTLAVLLPYISPSRGCEIALLDNPGDGGPADVRRTIKLEGCPVGAFALSPDGSTLATSAVALGTKEPSRVILRDTRTGEARRTLEGHQEITDSLAFSPDGSKLASAGHTDGTVRLWDAGDGRMLKSFRAHERPNAVAFSPDGRVLATGGYDGKLMLWDASTGARTRTLQYGVNADGSSTIDVIAFSPDGSLVAVGGTDAAAPLKVWDARTGAQRASLKTQGWVMSLAFSQDGALLVCGTGSGDVVIYNVGRMDVSRAEADGGQTNSGRKPNSKPTPRPFAIRSLPDEAERRRRAAKSALDQ